MPGSPLLRGVALGLVALLGLGVVAWRLLAPSDPAGPVAGAGDPRGADLRDAPTARLLGRGDVAAAGAGSTAPSGEPVASTETGGDVPSPSTLLGRPCAIEVVDAGTGEPLEHVRAFAWVSGPSSAPLVELIVWEVPPRYAAARPGVALQYVPGTTSYRAVLPLWREVSLRVKVGARREGVPESRIVLEWRIGDEMGAGPTLPPGDGETVVSGIPHFPGERVKVGARRALDRDGRTEWGPLAWGEVQLVDDPDACHTLSLEAPPLREDPGPSPSQEEPAPSPRPAAPEPEGTGSSEAPDAGTGTLRVHVRRRDGVPMPQGVRVGSRSRQAWTDEAGVATFRDHPAGVTSVRLETSGLVSSAREVVVRRGGTTDVDLGESEGGSLHVAVVDERGRALPFAQVEIVPHSAVPYVDGEGGVYRLDAYTDVRGERTFRRVEAGRVTVRARYGSRVGEEVVDVREGEESAVRASVRPP